ncbi:MAG: PKD domain-containing protein, partial [Planctomycetes bacterium]|nr:PKD domain-containing protein [Planctomycetota bacterium]
MIHLAVDALTAFASAPAVANIGTTILLLGQAGGGFLPYSFRWTQIAGTQIDIKDETSPTALVTPTTPGTYTFQLRVEDSGGSAAIDEFSLDVVECIADGPCDDGDQCTEDDVCSSGVCVGVVVSCDDGNPCTIDTCTDDA